MHKCRIYDHFTIWLSSETLAFNLNEQLFQMALLLLKEHNCVILFWNPCINVEDKARTSSIIWPSVVTLTFSLPEQMFQVALPLPKKNNYARLFWNPCINVEDMARTSSIYWPFYHLTFKCDPELPHTWINVSNDTATPLREQLCQIILKFMHKCRSYGWDKRNICDLQVWHWPSTYLKCFNGTSLPHGDNYAKLFWNPCINVEVMAWTNPDWCMHTRTYARTHIHRKKL